MLETWRGQEGSSCVDLVQARINVSCSRTRAGRCYRDTGFSGYFISVIHIVICIAIRWSPIMIYRNTIFRGIPILIRHIAVTPVRLGINFTIILPKNGT